MLTWSKNIQAAFHRFFNNLQSAPDLMQPQCAVGATLRETPRVVCISSWQKTGLQIV